MSTTFEQICGLVQQSKVLISAHAYFRIAKRDFLIRDLVNGVENGEIVEDYPDYHAGPAVLAPQIDSLGHPLHVVWGVEKGTDEPAVIVTAYRPNPAEWSADFRSRL